MRRATRHSVRLDVVNLLRPATSPVDAGAWNYGARKAWLPRRRASVGCVNVKGRLPATPARPHTSTGAVEARISRLD